MHSRMLPCHSTTVACDAKNATLSPYNISIKLDDASTGITTADATKKDDGAAYNLNGQKVGKDYKGIVIRNGKKFMIK